MNVTSVYRSLSRIFSRTLLKNSQLVLLKFWWFVNAFAKSKSHRGILVHTSTYQAHNRYVTTLSESFSVERLCERPSLADACKQQREIDIVCELCESADYGLALTLQNGAQLELLR